MSKSLKGALGLAAMVLGVAALVAPAQAAVAQAEVVAIADADRQTYGTAAAWGTNDPYVRMLGRQNTPNQAWEHVPGKEGSTFVNQGTRGCLMVDTLGPVNGLVVQRPCTGGAQEVWALRPAGPNGVVLIVNAGGGCLTQPPPFGSDNRLRVGLCDGIRQGFRLLQLG